jgi:hypothetical protein
MSIVIGAIVLGVAGSVGVAAYLNSRDDATLTSGRDAGRPRSPGARPAVRPGNVLLLYADERQAPALRALRRELTGSDPALVAAGQAVLVRRDPRLSAPVVALSARHRRAADAASEPAVRDFVEYWLGRATG